MDHSEYINQISQEVLVMQTESLNQLVKTWEVLYDFNEEKKQTMALRFKNHCKDFFTNMTDSEIERVAKLEAEIKLIIAEKTNLERELGVNIPITSDVEHQPLITRKECLDNLLKCPREIKQARLAQMSELKQQLTSLKNQLGLENFASVEFAKVPSENDLISIRSQIIELQEEKALRIDNLNEMKNVLQNFFSQLEIPEESLDDSSNFTLRHLLLSDKDEWPLQMNQIQPLNELISNCKTNLEQAQKDKETLLQKLQSLWNVNKEDTEYQYDFLLTNNLYGEKTFDKINEEIERSKQIRKNKAKELTLQLRKEIKSLWSQLGFTKDKCDSFKLMIKEEFSLEMLDKHENYLKELTSYYDKYKDLYKLIEERKTMWFAWVELEKKVLDKNRFNNRGGQLLKEEKERNMLEKKLPKIEKEILAKVQAHLVAEGEPFLWQGHDVQVTMDSDHKKLEALKQEIKMSKNNEQTSCGSTVKRKLLTPSGSRNVGCNMVFTSPLPPERTPISSPAITPISSLRQPLVERVRQEASPSTSECIVISSSPDEPSCICISSSSDNDE